MSTRLVLWSVTLCLLCLGIISSPSAAEITDIDDIQLYDNAGTPVSPYIGQIVTVHGVVTTVKGTWNAGSHYVEDATGGLLIFDPSAPALALGDIVEVTGQVITFSGENEIDMRLDNVSSWTIISQGNPDPAPTGMTINQILDYGGNGTNQDESEDWEVVGYFVTTAGTVASITDAYHKTITVADGPDVLTIFIDFDTGIDISGMAVGDYYQFTGPVANYWGLLELKPRRQSDVVEIIPDVIEPVPDLDPLPVVQGTCEATIATIPTATDETAPLVIYGTTTDPLTYTEQGTYVVHWTYTDNAGNSSTQEQTVIVEDAAAPVLTLPPDVVAATATDATSCGVFLDPSELGYPSATDNCSGSLTVSPTTPLPSDGFYPVGVTEIQYSATDEAGNTVTGTQTVTIHDETPPALTLPQDLEFTLGSGATSCGVVLDPLQLGDATATDNCSEPVSVTRITPLPADGFYPVGITEIEYVATDEAGNTTTGKQTVTVRDDTPPVLTLPPNIEVTTGPNATTCGVVLDPSQLGYATATDNCTEDVFIARAPLPTGGFYPVGVTEIAYWATDNSTNTATATQTVTVYDGTPPTIACADVSVTTDFNSCNASVSFAPEFSDNCPGVTFAPTDGTYPVGTTQVILTATDEAGNESTCTVNVEVSNPDPVVSITAPASGALFATGTPVNFSGSFTDENGGTHSAVWSFGASHSTVGTVNDATGEVTGSYSFESAGVYLVSLTVADQCGGSGAASTIDNIDAMVVVYDASAGFVTGGGWIDSPPGAYPADPSLTGKANFGFVSKYKKGATTPTGETEFRFRTADLSFHSTSYEWLVIAGARAQYKGLGTINGEGNYGFVLTAIDGAVNGGGEADRFRMKIVDKSTDIVVYDNQLGASEGDNPTTLLGGGNVVIHTGKDTEVASAGGVGIEAVPGAHTSTPTEFRLYTNRPNPFAGTTSIHFDLPQATRVEIPIYNVVGRVVRRLVNGEMTAGSHAIQWDRRDDSGRQLAPGIYFYELRVANKVIDRKKAVVVR